MKVGVGVISAGKREIAPQYKQFTKYELFIYTDVERKGPAFARNQVLKHFKGYDYVFIFDDDTWPVNHGWEDFFIEEAQKDNVHWMGMPHAYFEHSLKAAKGTMSYWHETYGMMQFFTKHAMETIGGYNAALKTYGWEDLGVMRRALKAGLTGSEDGLYAFPIRGLHYIYPRDSFPDYYDKTYTNEEKTIFVKQNEKAFFEEYNGDQLFFPFE